MKKILNNIAKTLIQYCKTILWIVEHTMFIENYTKFADEFGEVIKYNHDELLDFCTRSADETQ